MMKYDDDDDSGVEWKGIAFVSLVKGTGGYEESDAGT